MEQNEITYSKAIEELESILAAMQSDKCSIDNLSGLTSRALELLKVCKTKLHQTDTELQKILSELEK